jgi:SAM-dependent methyltransferase
VTCDRDAWQSPYYRYKVDRFDVVVKVTDSAPTFPGPAPGLDKVATVLRERGIMRILDFGAGKLRNTLYLLRRHWGFNLNAVEFKECFETPEARKNLASAERFAGSFRLEYPSQFLSNGERYDAVLLINVLSVIPDPRDRRRVLSECASRLGTGGLLFWMSQHDEPHYYPGVTQRLRLNDGWCYSLHQRSQTFFHEFTTGEIDALVLRRGFKEHSRILAKHHHALLYERL